MYRIKTRPVGFHDEALLITNNYILKTKDQYPVLHPTYNGMHYAEKMTEKQLKQLKKYLER